MTADLEAALGRLEDVLDGVEANVDDFCGFCYSEADAKALAGPVDRFPQSLLTSVAMEVPDHFDDYANLYRKVTPRVMALMVRDELHVDENLIAKRIAEVGCWSTWADDERDAMLSVCQAWWEDTLTTHPRQPEAHVVLGFLATTSVPVTHWFELWNALPPGAADLQAVDLCRRWVLQLPGDVKVGYSEDIDITADLRQWMFTDARPRLVRAEATDVLDIFEWI
ncbi:hypothetical protein ACIBG5_18250 [Kribbella sp. NPDC050241]|uniref:hypothetical protein n=1 Tax=Kribbella sp. NPDC050241 TaxID=3364115 RepID=UPI0037B40467